MVNRHNRLLVTFHVLTDALLAVSAFIIAYNLRFHAGLIPAPKGIPPLRQYLNVLPFITTCIECQREMEVHGTWRGRGADGNWEKVSDNEAPLEEQREVDLSDLEMDLSSNR